MKKPKVREKFTDAAQFKECLTYYGLANGYSIWCYRSLKTQIIARCGQRPERIKDPKKGKLSKWKRYPSENSTEGAECPWRCKHFGNKIRMNPDIKLHEIADMVMKKYKCIVSPSNDMGGSMSMSGRGRGRGPRLGRLGAWFGIDGNEFDSTENTQEETMHDSEIQESQTVQTAPTQSSQTAASDGIAVDNQVVPVNEPVPREPLDLEYMSMEELCHSQG
ncbi:hypothetical protein Tco_0766778 [Tanacetum coccineum]